MENSNLTQEPLLSWIDPYSHEQTTWIEKYISKKEMPFELLGLPKFSNFPKIIEFLIKNQGDAKYREVIKDMRNAWNQKQYRERSGKQVSFQLPNAIINHLDSIAKDRNQSRTQTLRQLINNAAKQKKVESKKQAKRIERLENNLKKLQKEKQDAENVRNKIIKKLSESLVEEVMHKCCYESTVGSMSAREIEDSKDTRHQELVKKRIEEIESRIPDMQYFRTSFPKIRSYLPF